MSIECMAIKKSKQLQDWTELASIQTVCMHVCARTHAHMCVCWRGGGSPKYQ